MLHLIQNSNDDLFDYLTQDPVRPTIPTLARIGDNKDIFVLRSLDKVQAITCVSYQDSIPRSESDLFCTQDQPWCAIFYTIWSYQSGSGRDLIFQSVEHISKTKPTIKRFLTLSPKTDMAQKFHLKNGATIFRENVDTVNYEYIIHKPR